MPTTTYTPLANITLGSSASSVTFSNIPNTYRDLILVLNLKDGSSTRTTSNVRINGDTGTNYSQVRMGGNGSTTNSGSLTLNYFYALQSGQWNTQIFQFMDYSATDKHKTVLWRINDNYTESASESISAFAGRWANTNAITSIGIIAASGSPFSIGSTFALYGVIA